MKRRGRLGAEIALVVLVLSTMAGSLALVVEAHRRSTARKPAPSIAVVEAPAPLLPVIEPKVEAKPIPPEPAPPTPEDPTPKALARIAELANLEASKAAEADRKAEALEAAEKSAKEEADRWRTRQSLVGRQVDALEEQAKKAEDEFDALAKERDALAEIKEKAQAELNKANLPGGMAVLPYKGPSGTWRRPIAIECIDGEARLQPGGPSFGLFEMSKASGVGPASPIVRAVARALSKAGENVGPDGGQVVPYIVFVIRPDGVRPYYEARARLEPLGIAFGYELVDKDTPIEFPDLNNPAEWRDAASGDSATPPARGPAGREGLAFDGGPAWPPRSAVTPDVGMLKRGGTYANSSMVRGEMDPRQRLQYDPSTSSGLRSLNRQLTQPLPNPSGRVELTENEDAVLPSLAPTPPSPVAEGLGGLKPDGSGLGSDRMPSMPGRSAPGMSPDLGGGGGGAESMTPGGRFRAGGGSGGGFSGGSPTGGPGGLSGVQNGSTGGLAPPPPGTFRSAIGSPGGSPADPNGSLGGLGDPTREMAGGGGLDAPSNPQGGLSGGGSGGIGSLSGGNDSSGGSTSEGSGIFSGSAGGANPPAGTGRYASTNPANSNPSANPSAGSGPAGPGWSGDPVTGSASNLPQAASSTNQASSLPKAASSMFQPTPPTDSSAGSDQDSAAYRPFSSSGSEPRANPSGNPGDFPSAASSMPGNPNGTGSIPVASSSSSAAGSPTSVASSNSTEASSPNPTSGKAGDSAQSTLASANAGKESSPGGQNHAPVNLPPVLTIEKRKVPFEVVLVCGPKGVTVHPGGYRFSAAKIDDPDRALLKTLKSLERSQRLATPKDDVRPFVKFLVEPGGQATYRKAREQTLMGDLNWPATLKVVESNPLRVYAKEAW